MATPITSNYNAFLASEMYQTKFKGENGKNANQFKNNVQAPKANPEVTGVNPFTKAAPISHTAEAYEGQGTVSFIAQKKAKMAEVGLGGNPHATETLGNRLNVTEYDMF